MEASDRFESNAPSGTDQSSGVKRGWGRQIAWFAAAAISWYLLGIAVTAIWFVCQWLLLPVTPWRLFDPPVIAFGVLFAAVVGFLTARPYMRFARTRGAGSALALAPVVGALLGLCSALIPLITGIAGNVGSPGFTTIATMELQDAFTGQANTMAACVFGTIGALLELRRADRARRGMSEIANQADSPLQGPRRPAEPLDAQQQSAARLWTRAAWGAGIALVVMSIAAAMGFAISLNDAMSGSPQAGSEVALMLAVVGPIVALACFGGLLVALAGRWGSRHPRRRRVAAWAQVLLGIGFVVAVSLTVLRLAAPWVLTGGPHAVNGGKDWVANNHSVPVPMRMLDEIIETYPQWEVSNVSMETSSGAKVYRFELNWDGPGSLRTIVGVTGREDSDQRVLEVQRRVLGNFLGTKDFVQAFSRRHPEQDWVVTVLSAPPLDPTSVAQSGGATVTVAAIRVGTSSGSSAEPDRARIVEQWRVAAMNPNSGGDLRWSFIAARSH